MNEPKKTCGTCRHAKPCALQGWRCDVSIPIRHQVALDDDATDCLCYEPTPLVASIGRNKPAAEPASDPDLVDPAIWPVLITAMEKLPKVAEDDHGEPDPEPFV